MFSSNKGHFAQERISSALVQDEQNIWLFLKKISDFPLLQKEQVAQKSVFHLSFTGDTRNNT